MLAAVPHSTMCRIAVEDAYLRSLEKLARPPRPFLSGCVMLHVCTGLTAHRSAAPCWNVLSTMTLDIVLIHRSLKSNLNELLASAKSVQDKHREAQSLVGRPLCCALS